jgi:hypothetical protein
MPQNQLQIQAHKMENEGSIQSSRSCSENRPINLRSDPSNNTQWSGSSTREAKNLAKSTKPGLTV